MAIHESSVNFSNLIQDLADMYPFETGEVVLVELVANSLDAGATSISIRFDPSSRVLIVEDNGEGMNSSQFEEYHDFAAGLKARGTGIGFAGLGAKISFNLADRVVTETQSESFSGGSNWYLQSKRRLVWEDIQPTHLLGYGTRVEVWFRPDARLSYTSAEDLIRLLRRHYLPLTDAKFLDLYDRLGFYSKDLRFVVNDQVVKPGDVVAELGLDRVKEFFPASSGNRFGYGIFGLAASDFPLSGDVCGVLLCTRGKVIKADLFNQFPGNLGPRLLGLVEVPEFVKFLTTAKTDFARKGKHKEFERFYNPIRQEFKSWLRDLGIEPLEMTNTPETIRLERELKKLLDEVPELGEFLGFRTRKAVLVPSEAGLDTATVQEGIQVTFPFGEGSKGQTPGPSDVGDQAGQTLVEDKKTGATRARPISRVGRTGPKVTFAEAFDRVDLAWVDGNSVVINSGHSCYLRAGSNVWTRRLHNLFAIATAVQRFLAGESTTASDLMFIDRMMAAWGKK